MNRADDVPAPPPPGAARRVVLIGGEPLLIACASMLRERGHAIAAVVPTQPPVRRWAVAEGHVVLDDLSPDVVGTVDYLFSITNLTVLPPEVLALPMRGAINFHDGPLPAYGGLNTPVWALLNGEPRHGITWHRMTAAVDAGDVIAARAFDIDPLDTAHTLNTRCFAAAIDSFAEVLDALDAGAPPLAPGQAPLRRYGRQDRPPLAATIRWSDPVDRIAAFVRALDHGGHANPLGSPKFAIGGDIVLVTRAAPRPHRSGAAPGTVTHVDAARIAVATATGDLDLLGLATASGTPLTPSEAAARYGLRPGLPSTMPIGAAAEALSTLDAAAARHEGWWRARLAAAVPLTLPHARTDTAPSGAIDLAVDDAPSAATLLAATVACLARIADRSRFDLGYADPLFATHHGDPAPWFAAHLPLSVAVDFDVGLASLRDTLADDIRQMRRRIGHTVDLVARCPELDPASAGFPVALTVVDRLDDAMPAGGAWLTIALRADGGAMRWLHGAGLDVATVRSMQRSLTTLLAAAMAEPDRPIATLPLLSAEDLADETARSTGSRIDGGPAACIHDLFAAQAARTPDAPAITSRGTTLTYREVDARSNRLARHLRALGVGPDTLVGLHVRRSVEMIVAAIGIHKAGGAYVPLDPAYPTDRIAHMLSDSEAPVIVTDAHGASGLPPTSATLVRIDADWPLIANQPADPVLGSAGPTNLAYAIYTSGSTGTPKGVLVEHRNVANFFTGMDRVIEPGGTWLAVTSLSFDISVLELFWTLAHGCHVVIATGEAMKRPAAPPKRPVEFSLFYFASADGAAAADQYRLLLDGARFADAHGFAAVWTPERHFHAFGGLYPNPSVTAAAIATITTRIRIRGGSVVAPLHHPVRIAEEWALVDNLSQGRVGIAFAAGWQPNDFVLRPQNFADRNGALATTLDTVRALWRGERRAFAGPLGTDVEVAVYPRPVQPELPCWITTAGNPDTFAAAGRAGAFVLTHLLGQSVDELAAKLALYRAAWREAGYPGDGHATLMLHSFVGDDADAVRAAVREPLTAYLRTSTNLVKEFAWSFPAFKRRPGMEADAPPDLDRLDADEMAALLDHAFDRYYDSGGLFGTPEHCLAMVDRVRAAGVDEIGCLIDFGVPADTVLDHLPALDTLRQLAMPDIAEEEETLAGLMRRHAATHLQCTPSMAQMLAGDEDARPCLAALRQMMVGGEAFPPALAADLTALVGGSVLNMYGPTETTIWSAVHVLDRTPGPVPLGRPLANQQVHILDGRGQPVPAGVPGELVIGGRGVARGYWRRPELTAERFVADPFDSDARAYRTGDLARRRADGALEFLGRRDHQVKIRGHRIELGEIEAVLGRYPGVERAIAVVREDVPGDIRLAAYYVARANAPQPGDLRAHLASSLPDFMLPAHLIALPALPQTPNGKVDRAALPPPGTLVAVETVAPVAPADDMEARIAAVWQDVLKLPQVGTQDNFFDIGGHSLLAVQVHRWLRDALARPLPLTDIFRFPTIRTLAAHLSRGDADTGLHEADARASGRRAALQRRMGQRVSATGARG